MQTNHTPAPWTIATLKHCYHIQAGYEHIASLVHIDQPNAEANAKLIAAAPKMLEALNTALIDTEMLLNEECEFCPVNLLGTIHILKEAIQKATL